MSATREVSIPTTALKGRDFITTQEWSLDELEAALELAADLKRAKRAGRPTPLLPAKTLYMIFFDASTRTRNSFETGMTQLGGHAIYLSPDRMQISHGENARDTAHVLSRYGEGIAIRHCAWGEGNGYLREVARHASVPVLNMQCDVYHPHQILADLLTMREKKGGLRGRTITISWAYAATYQKPISVPQDLLLAATRYGMDVRLVHPPEFELMPDILAEAEDNARRSGARLERLDDFDAGVRGSEIVYAKSWGALLRAKDDEEGASIATGYTDWIADERRMATAAPDAIYMHPLPAERNVEVTDGVIDGRWSVVYDQAENRLHAQKAVMALTMR